MRKIAKVLKRFSHEEILNIIKLYETNSLTNVAKLINSVLSENDMIQIKAYCFKNDIKFIKKPETIKFKRECPICSESIYHKNKHTLDSALKKNSMCKVCQVKSMMFNFTTEQEEEIAHLYAEKQQSLDEICAIFNVNSRRVIKKILNKKGIDIRSGGWTKILPEKVCTRCDKVKELEYFCKSKRNADGRNSICKECINLEKSDKMDSLRNHGLSKTWYDEKFEEQGGVCDICKRFKLHGNSKRLNVDHNHTTGEIRGLLCHYCNAAIGLFEENTSYILSAKDYIDKYNQHTFQI